MKLNPLGTSGLNVTDICLGTMTWGRQNTESEGHTQMDYALDFGVNFFDTAELYAVPPLPETYGRTEEIIGTWFASRKSRDKVILASKIAGQGYKHIRGGEPIDGKNIYQAVEDSLRRLQTDYIDIYQLHWPRRPSPYFSNRGAGRIDFTALNTEEEEAHLLSILRALGDMVKQGKIRHAGLSNDSAWGIMKYIELAKKHDLPRIVSIQNEFGLLCRSDDPQITEICVREKVAYLPWSPLSTGMLSGKYMNGARPAGTRWAVDERPLHRDKPAAHAAVDEYLKIAQKHGLDVCQMGLAFCRQQSFVTSTIIGATSMEQLKNNLASTSLTLNQDVLDDIERVHRQYPVPF